MISSLHWLRIEEAETCHSFGVVLIFVLGRVSSHNARLALGLQSDNQLLLRLKSHYGRGGLSS